VSSLADHILLVLFPVFEQFRKSDHKDFNSFAANILSQNNWGDQKYLEEHIRGIAVRVNEDIKKINGANRNRSSYYT
jgi:hypothetical protein